MRKRNLLFGLLVVGLVAGLTTPVLAYPGHGDPEHDKMAQATAARADGQSGESGEADDGQPSLKNQAAEAAKLRTRGRELLTQLKAERQQHSKEERRKNCQSRKQGLQIKLDNLAKNAQKHKERIDGVFDKLAAYQREHNLDVENFEALVTMATAAQGTAQSSVAALGELKPTLDCNNESVASDVAAFKVAAAQARSDLSEYRQAVKAILKAVQAVKAEGDQ